MQVNCICQPQVMLLTLANRKTQLFGQFRVTDYAMYMISLDQVILHIPFGYILKCERTSEDKSTDLQITLRYGFSFKLRYPQNKWQGSLKALAIITALINNSRDNAFRHGQTNSLRCMNKDSPSSPVGTLINNLEYRFYPAYPTTFYTLSPTKYNEERFIMLTSHHKGVSCWRSGPGRADSEEDKYVLDKNMFVLDIKSKFIFSKRDNYKSMEIDTSIRDAFLRMWGVFLKADQSRFLSAVYQTRWYEQVCKLLDEAYNLSKRIIDGKNINVVILSENQVRGAQVAVLAQVIMFPFARSMVGFGGVVERELLQVGFSKNNKKEEDKGYAIIQMFDCVHQLVKMFPLSFQFNQSYLVHLAKHVYSQKYGNFLFATKIIQVMLHSIQESQRSRIQKCVCIWKDCLKEKKKFINPFYVESQECDEFQLQKEFSQYEIKIWIQFFGVVGVLPKETVLLKHKAIADAHYQHKQKVKVLRKIVAEQQQFIKMKTQQLNQSF